jgi:glycosyltransferase involved in cell wall biosynthesis
MHPNKIKIRGWRHISHSYAMVNQFQLLAMHRLAPELICHEDVPYLVTNWNTKDNASGLLPQDAELIQSIGDASEYGATYNIFAPGALPPSIHHRCMTFLVTETGYSENHFASEDIHQYQGNGGSIHTPSHWSRDRIMEAGLAGETIHVIPHAADEKYFFSYGAEKISELRGNLNFNEDDVILLNVGSFYWNKGLDILVKSFARAREKNRRLKLVLKDQRVTYGVSSKGYIAQYLSEIGKLDEDTLNAILVIDANVSLHQLNDLYNIVDAYVTPYRAEGFNLPACEAQQCKTPVIATLGGATDDFLAGETNILIPGQLIRNRHVDPQHTRVTYIEPEQDVLMDILATIERKLLVPRPAVLEQPAWTWRDAALKIMGTLI